MFSCRIRGLVRRFGGREGQGVSFLPGGLTCKWLESLLGELGDGVSDSGGSVTGAGNL